jgi:glycosyltransferase involved in cell wall biosynthesis
LKTKIVHILHAVGGVEVSLRLILGNINPDAFESVVIHGTNDTDKPFLDNNGIGVKAYQAPIFRDVNPLHDVKAISKVAAYVKKENPDLIHAHSAKGGVIAKIVGAQLKIPVVHTPQAYSFLSTQNRIKRSLFLQVEKGLSRFNNAILASSNSELNRAKNEVGYKPERLYLFNNAINPIKHASDLSIEKTWPDEYICSVGRPSFQKNIELMIDVMDKLRQKKPSIHLVLMGVGFHAPNLESVTSKIDALGLENNITLLEWTDRQDIFHIIHASQLYISTARYEGLPYSIIEALALGKACVVTDADGNRDLIRDDYNGFVIHNEDVNAFSDMVMTLLQDEGIRTRFENASLQRFNSEFNIENTIGNLEKIYLEEIQKNKKP